MRSVDSKTTLLHYLARAMLARDPRCLTKLATQTSALERARGVSLGEKRAEAETASQALQNMRALLGSSAKDPLAKLLKPSVAEHGPTLDALQAQLKKADVVLKELAIWFAEKPAPPADVFGPLAAFVLDLELAAKESLGEEEREKELARKERLRDTFSRGAQQRRDFMQACTARPSAHQG